MLKGFDNEKQGIKTQSIRGYRNNQHITAVCECLKIFLGWSCLGINHDMLVFTCISCSLPLINDLEGKSFSSCPSGRTSVWITVNKQCGLVLLQICRKVHSACRLCLSAFETRHGDDHFFSYSF